MAREGKYGVRNTNNNRGPIWRETFDGITNSPNYGDTTTVTSVNGVGTFNGTTSNIIYEQTLNNTYSIRIRFISLSPAATQYLLDYRKDGGIGYVRIDSAVAVSASSGTVYVDGVLGSTISSSTKEITVTGITLNSTRLYIGSDNTGASFFTGSIELIDLFDYTLTSTNVEELSKDSYFVISSWTALLDFWFLQRSGNEFIDKYGNVSAKILFSASHFDATHYISYTTANFGAATSRKPIEVRVYIASLSTNLYIFSSADEGTTTKYFYVAISNGKPIIRVFNASPAIGNAINADNALSVGWHTIIYDPTGDHYKITVDGVALTVGAGLTVSTGSDNGKWIEDVLDRDNIYFGAVKRTGLVASTGSLYVDYIKFGTLNRWNLTGRNGIIYDTIGSIHLPWWPQTVQWIWNNDSGRDFLDYGFTVWTKDAVLDTLVPYSAVNTPVDASAYLTSLGYAKLADYNGATDGLVNEYLYRNNNYMNSPPCIIAFNEMENIDIIYEIFDRSNTTRQEDLSRTYTDYDATSLATKSRYFSGLCLKYPILMTLFKEGYKNRIIPIMDDEDNPTKCTGFMVAKINLT